MTLIEQKREQTQRAWKIAIRALATAFAIVALGLQIKITGTHANPDNHGDSYFYYNDFSDLWVSPESFIFVSRPSLHIVAHAHKAYN